MTKTILDSINDALRSSKVSKLFETCDKFTTIKIDINKAIVFSTNPEVASFEVSLPHLKEVLEDWLELREALNEE